MRPVISRSTKQMGLLIHTSFQTQEGISITSVYCRIVEVIYRPHSGGQYTISYKMEFYVDRNARLNGKQPIRVPTLGDGQTYVGTFGDITYLYGLLKENLEGAGFTIENVDPDPAPAPEPAPAPAPEPAPAPAPEPAPEPAATEYGPV